MSTKPWPPRVGTRTPKVTMISVLSDGSGSHCRDTRVTTATPPLLSSLYTLKSVCLNLIFSFNFVSQTQAKSISLFRSVICAVHEMLVRSFLQLAITGIMLASTFGTLRFNHRKGLCMAGAQAVLTEHSFLAVGPDGKQKSV